MGQIALSLPVVGQTNASQEPLIPGDFTTIQNVINGNIDATNVSAALAQSAAVNQSGQTVKGVSNIVTSESRTNVAYGTLTTPDQVTVVLPANGLIAVWYQAMWQESVLNAARAAIFIGANQLQIQQATAHTPVPVATGMGNPSGTAVNTSLSSSPGGLMSLASGVAQAADATTGQIVGMFGTYTYPYEVNGIIQTTVLQGLIAGPCSVSATAGTYTISVQFKASSGSVTASNRKLWAQASSFA